MPTDWRYSNGDRVLGADGNYETTPGQADAMLREMSCDVVEIDGAIYGNRAWSLVTRGVDTDESREVVRRCYEEVGQRYVAGGGIKDLEVEISAAVGLDGVAIHVRCWDVMRSRSIDTALPVVLVK